MILSTRREFFNIAFRQVVIVLSIHLAAYVASLAPLTIFLKNLHPAVSLIQLGLFVLSRILSGIFFYALHSFKYDYEKAGGMIMSNQDEGKKKIILPEKLQAEMMKFFLNTSIPRKKMEQKAKSLSEK